MKRLLVVIDYQNDFIDGALGFSGAELLGSKIADKIKDYRAVEDIVAFTYDTHGHDYLETQEGRFLPVTHCIKGSDGWKLHESIAPLQKDDDPVFYKHSFGSSELFEWLYTAQKVATEIGVNAYRSIELCGLVSNICVLSNAALVKAACPEVPVVVDASCTLSNDARLHEEALDMLESIQVQVINRPKP